MRAIDLYAGIGGWALGLKMAGIDVVASYEWWGPAAATHRANLPGTVHEVDIRAMPLSKLPKNIDVVVGSPPCTQFSYANRGGSGDIADGLKDLYRFFEVVRHLKPKHWAMENVPRVAEVIKREILPGGSLEAFHDIITTANIKIVDMSDFGVPQRRKRCIVGNFDEESLSVWARRTQTRTLGDVLNGLKNNEDPNYIGHKTNRLTETENERPLNYEEARFNREMKAHHPVYNGMAFPEDVTRPSRTITATCTRVSRESLVVEDEIRQFRRLSVRERASLQSFPVSYQFHGKSYPEKLKMIGNAIPPIFTFYIAQCFKGVNPATGLIANQIDANVHIETSHAPKTSPDVEKPTYRADRRFRFAIPSLRFKSGVRFDLTNEAHELPWRAEFYFGDSKRIERRIFFSLTLPKELSECDFVTEAELRVRNLVNQNCMETMQLVWAHQIEAIEPHPFTFIDEIGKIAETLSGSISAIVDKDKATEIVLSFLKEGSGEVIGKNKIGRFSIPILAGAIVSTALNSECKKIYALKAA